MTQKNEIRSFGNGGISFNGPEAVDVFRIATLRSAIGLLTKGISPTRGLTMKRALAMATEYTGKPYKRSEAEQARADLEAHATNKAAAIRAVQS